MENRIVFNRTLNSCFIKPNVNFPNGSYLEYDSCPDWYNSSRKLVRHCCLKIILNKLEDDSNLKKIQDWLTYHSSSLLVAPAIIFNLLSFLVLSRFSKLNASATSINFYMQCLCIFDTLTILSKFVHEYVVVKNSIRTIPFELNPSVCKLTHFSESTFGITSIYILILMSIDKLICVAFPLKSGSLLRPKRAKIIGLIILLSSMAYSSYIIVNTTVFLKDSNSTAGYECVDKDQDLARNMNIIDNIVRVFVPILLLCVCNLSIAVVLARARKNTRIMLSEPSNDTSAFSMNNFKKSRKSTLNVDVKYEAGHEETLLSAPNTSCYLTYADSENTASVSSSNVSRTEKKCCTSLQMPNGCMAKIRNKNMNKNTQSSVHNNSKADKNSNYISVMLFTVSLGFILLNLPFAIKTIYEKNFKEKHNILEFLYHDDDNHIFTKGDIEKSIKYDFFVYITHFLLDLNYIANFFFYFLSGNKIFCGIFFHFLIYSYNFFLSGSRFRNRLYALVCCKDMNAFTSKCSKPAQTSNITKSNQKN